MEQGPSGKAGCSLVRQELFQMLSDPEAFVPVFSTTHQLSLS